jgi:hypothetical protein
MNHPTTQYQFQVDPNQFNNSPYQTPASSVTPQPPVGYQGQARFAAQSHPLSGQVNPPAASPQPAQAPAVAAAKRASSAAQKPVTQAINPSIAPNATASPLAPAVIPPLSAVPRPNNYQMTGLPTPAVARQPGVQAGSTGTIIQSKPAFDPASAKDFAQVMDSANLFVKNTPTDLAGARLPPERFIPYVAQFNKADSALVRDRKDRLPCEIQRDWDWLHKQEMGAGYDAKKQAILALKEKLDKEMVQLTGDHSKYRPRVGLVRNHVDITCRFFKRLQSVGPKLGH